jgi:hypothetical protein
MEVPPDIVLATNLQRGHVWHYKEYPFADGQIKNKFFVVLSVTTTANPTHTFFATSQVEKIKQNPRWLQDSVTIAAGTVPFFVKETIINCREIHSFHRHVLVDGLANGRLTYCGQLPDYVIDNIDKVIDASILFSEVDKESILPDQSKLRTIRADQESEK